MAEAQTDRVGLSIVEESTYGVTPSGNLQRLRFTGESLRQDTQTTQSNEITTDRQITDIIRTQISASGGINAEVSYGAHDLLLQMGFASAGWSSPVTVGPVTTISFAASSGTSQVITDSGSGFGSIVANQWVEVRGATNAANNGYFKVTSASAGSLTLQNASGVSETAGQTITVVMGGQMVNGTTLRSASIEREYGDISTFSAFLGMMVNDFSMDIALNSPITAAFNFLGSKQTTPGSTIGSGYDAAPTNNIMNVTDSVKGIISGGNSVCVTRANFQIQNNLRQRFCAGTLGATSIGAGKVVGTGTVQLYLEDMTHVDRYLAFSETSMAFIVEGPSGNAYVIEFPSVKLSQAPAPANAQNSDVFVDLQFAAKKDASEAITVRISRFAA